MNPASNLSEWIPPSTDTEEVIVPLNIPIPIPTPPQNGSLPKTPIPAQPVQPSPQSSSTPDLPTPVDKYVVPQLHRSTRLHVPISREATNDGLGHGTRLQAAID